MHHARHPLRRIAGIPVIAILALGVAAAGASAEVTIDKTGPATAAQGAPVVYTITVANADAVTPATGVTITDALPLGMEFLSFGASDPCAQASNTVTCAMGDVVSGIPESVTITARAAGLGAITNTASATSATPGGTVSDSLETVVTDQTAPTVTLSAPANGSTSNDRTPSFSGVAGTAEGDVALVTVDVFAGTGTGGTPVDTVTAVPGGDGSYTTDPVAPPLAGGKYTAQARQRDGVGNVGESGPATFTIDVTPPDIVLTTPVDGSATNDLRPSFSGTTDEPGPVTIEIFNGNTATGTAAFTFTANPGGPSGAYSATPPADLPENPYTARARQSDPFGNEGFSATRAFTADRTAPFISITAPAAGGATNDITPLITGLAGSVARDTVTVAVDVYPGPTIDAGEAPATTVVTTRDAGGGYSESTPIALAGTATPAGNVYTARARQADSAGNTGRSDARTFSVDTVVPDATIQLGPDGRAASDPPATNRSGRPEFTFTAGEPVAFTCKIDVDAPVPCTPGQPLTAAGGLPLADGPHTVTVTATDPATNADPTPATRSFSVDRTPPRPTIESPTAGQVVTTSRPTFAGVAGLAVGDKDTITIEVYSGPSPGGARFPDIQTVHQANGEWRVTAPQDIRDDQITVRAKQRDDAPGDGFSDPVTFVVDTGAPDTSITSGPEGDVAPGTTARFGFTSSESTATFECRLDDAPFTGCATGQAYGGLAAGAHAFEVRAVDAAGNRDASPARRTFTITVPAPRPPGSPPPAPPAPPPAVALRFPSKLELQRSTVSRRRLDVLAPITRRASGTAQVAFEAGGRTTRFTQRVDSTRGRLSFVRPLTAQQSRGGTGILTIRYPGDEDTRSQEVRLRAGPNGSGLRTIARPRIDGGRLRARGTIARGARGAVRVSIDWNATDGSTRTLERTASIEDGTWGLNSPLPADVRESIAARKGTVHSYTLFTGYLPRRMRGEMLSFEVLPFRG